MMENSFEVKENRSRYKELGQIFFDEGKHENIKIMDEFGLLVPETLVLGMGFSKSDCEQWIREHQEDDILLRTSNLKVERNSKSERNPEELDLNIENLKKLVNFEQALILQALPKESINHDSLSGICHFSSNLDPYYLNWEIFCHPDIASLSNRINLSSWWDISLKGVEVVQINKSKGNREVLQNYIYYRVGRELLKKIGIELPKLEEVKYKSDEWYRPVEYCKKSIDELPEDYSLSILQKRIDEDGLENLMPEYENLEILRNRYKQFRNVATYLNKINGDSFPFSFGVKFSILEYNDNKRTLLCWDLIKGA